MHLFYQRGEGIDLAFLLQRLGVQAWRHCTRSFVFVGLLVCPRKQLLSFALGPVRYARGLLCVSIQRQPGAVEEVPKTRVVVHPRSRQTCAFVQSA